MSVYTERMVVDGWVVDFDGTDEEPAWRFVRSGETFHTFRIELPRIDKEKASLLLTGYSIGHRYGVQDGRTQIKTAFYRLMDLRGT